MRSLQGVLLALLPLLAGCVQAERFLITRYDAKKDELHCLHCYMNISWG